MHDDCIFLNSFCYCSHRAHLFFEVELYTSHDILSNKDMNVKLRKSDTMERLNKNVSMGKLVFSVEWSNCKSPKKKSVLCGVGWIEKLRDWINDILLCYLRLCIFHLKLNKCSSHVNPYFVLWTKKECLLIKLNIERKQQLNINLILNCFSICKIIWYIHYTLSQNYFN